jgi:hypothetical protein
VGGGEGGPGCFVWRAAGDRIDSGGWSPGQDKAESGTQTWLGQSPEPQLDTPRSFVLATDGSL